MLALMPPSAASDLQQDPFTTTAGSMSVAVLQPAPVLYGQVSMFAPTAAPSKRPKLSLNTATTSTSPFRSKQSTSLRLDTLSATSPTARNTYGNAYAPATTFSRPATPLRKDSAQADTPIDKAIVLPSASPLSATYEVEPTVTFVPYTLDDDVNPILRNGPRDHKHHRRRSSSRSKPIFALTKRVLFKAPLTEEVRTKHYTLRHSDIAATSSTIHDEDKLRRLAVRSLQEQDINEDSDASACPATPVAGRNKKDRHWYWTLGPERFGEDLSGNALATPVDADVS